MPIPRIVRIMTLLPLFLLLTACPVSETGGGVDDTPPAESYAPGRSGEVRTSDLVLPGETTPTTLTYEVFDGLAVFQGDIILGPADALTTEAIAISGTDLLWPGGTVPYTIDSSLNATMQGRVNAAVQHWNTETNLTLVERDGEADYVEFTLGSGCSSSIGRQTGKQEIFLYDGANGGFACGFGNTVHEIGHAIGLWHEQSREDRDVHVEILIENVQDDKTHNFEQHTDDGTDVDEYDHGSVMHYGSTAFGKTGPDGNRLTTIRTIPAGLAIGQRGGLSDLDIAAANRLYPAEPTPYLLVVRNGPTVPQEDDDITFSATVVDDIDVDLADYELTWSYDQWNGVPFFFDWTTTEETTQAIRLCDGVYTVDVEAYNAQTGGTAFGAATFTVANADPKPVACDWSVAIVEPMDGATFTTADSVRLRAAIDDDHPETDAPLSSVIWRLGGPEGTIIQQSDILDFTRSKWGIGTQVIHVEYGHVSDQISFEIVAATNTTPTVTITSPQDGDTINYLNYDFDSSAMYLPVSGSAQDSEDGSLSGAALSWSYRVLGEVSWRDVTVNASGEIAISLVDISPSNTIEIRLEAEDSGGLIGYEIIEVFILGVQG